MNTETLSDLFELRRQYFSLYPAIFLRLPSTSNLSSSAGQQYLIDHILADERLSLKGKEPERGYRKQFWKRVMKDLEAGVEARVEAGEDLELDERLYEAYADLMVSSAAGGLQQGPQASYKTFIYNALNEDVEQEKMITLYEEQVTVQAGSTGLRTWTASLHLAHQILHNPALVSPGDLQDIPILELGAGTGFLSIFLAQQGAQVVTTDLGDDSGEEEFGSDRRTPLESLAHNISLNELTCPPAVKSMDWFDSLQPEAEQSAGFRDIVEAGIDGKGVVVAADVIYDPSIVPALVATISLLLRSRSHALIAATVRNETTLALFITSCNEAGLIVHHLQLTPMPSHQPTFYDSGAMGVDEEVRILRIKQTPPTER